MKPTLPVCWQLLKIARRHREGAVEAGSARVRNFDRGRILRSDRDRCSPTPCDVQSKRKPLARSWCPTSRVYVKLTEDLRLKSSAWFRRSTGFRKTRDMWPHISPSDFRSPAILETLSVTALL